MKNFIHVALFSCGEVFGLFYSPVRQCFPSGFDCAFERTDWVCWRQRLHVILLFTTECSTKLDTYMFIDYIYYSLIFVDIRACLCTYEWVGAHACSWVCMWRPKKKTLGAISQSLCILLFWKQGLLLVWGSPIRLGWLAIETQGTTCLYLSSSGISSEYQCARLEHRTLCWPRYLPQHLVLFIFTLFIYECGVYIDYVSSILLIVRGRMMGKVDFFMVFAMKHGKS